MMDAENYYVIKDSLMINLSLKDRILSILVNIIKNLISNYLYRLFYF